MGGLPCHHAHLSTQRNTHVRAKAIPAHTWHTLRVQLQFVPSTSSTTLFDAPSPRCSSYWYGLIGTFQQPSCTAEPFLEHFKVPDSSFSGKSGSCEEAQRERTRVLASDVQVRQGLEVRQSLEALVEGVALPDLTS